MLEAKHEYEKDVEHRVHMFTADTYEAIDLSRSRLNSSDFPRTYAYWRWNGSRKKRPMSSIVLEPGVKEMLLADCRDFLRSEYWCVHYLELTGI